MRVRKTMTTTWTAVWVWMMLTVLLLTDVLSSSAVVSAVETSSASASASASSSKQTKKQSKNSNNKKKSGIVSEDHHHHQSISDDIEFEEKAFHSQEDIAAYIQSLNRNLDQIGRHPPKKLAEFNFFPDESDIVQEELIRLRREELGLRIKLREIEEEYGVISEEYAAAMHRFGKNLHTQQRYDDLFIVAQEIVRIHEILDGPEHYHTGRALDNLATAAYRVKNQEACNTAMYRALHIFIKKFGDHSKQVSLVLCCCCLMCCAVVTVTLCSYY